MKPGSQLLGERGGVSGRGYRRCSCSTNCHVIRVPRDAIGPEGDHYLRTQLPDSRRHLTHHRTPRAGSQLPVDAAEEAQRPHSQLRTRVPQLPLPQRPQFLLPAEGRVAHAASLATGRTDEMDRHPLRRIFGQRTPDPEGLVVRVGKDPKQYGLGWTFQGNTVTFLSPREDSLVFRFYPTDGSSSGTSPIFSRVSLIISIEIPPANLALPSKPMIGSGTLPRPTTRSTAGNSSIRVE